METKTMFLFFALISCVAQVSLGLPRDKAFQQADNELLVINDDEKMQSEKPMEPFSKPVVMINGRLWCEFEEATEDEVCQAHCLPKGYSYGICVSHSCSCI